MPGRDLSEITVYPARRILTMNPSWPQATAIAVRDGHILEVGSLETLKPWLDVFPHRIDDSFADAVLMPGFIDPHLHPSMAAILLPMHFITAMEWKLPWETVRPVTTHSGFLDRLREIDRELTDPNEPILAWGYHHRWHGEMTRTAINSVSGRRPIVVWHRSFHELILGDGALEWLGITAAQVGDRKQIDYEKGRFFENGLGFAIAKLNPFIMAAERFHAGLDRLRQVVHFGGHTTIGDLAVGIFDFDSEWQGALEVLEQESTPFRVAMVPSAIRAFARLGSHEKALEFIESLPARNTRRLRFGNHVKLFADGAFFSELAQLMEPGYIDGHLGEWLTPPEQFEEMARVYWNSGFKIHVHCTGDLGLELALDTLEKLLWERPRLRHGYTIEHFGFSTPEQVERIAELGASVSANAYYLHELSHIYAEQAVGVERAHQMARLGACVRAGVRTSLHSDFTMAPALPLTSAWAATTRRNCHGEVVAPEERLTVDQAMRAITIDAAYVLGLENEVGSLRAGKRADFAVLDADPYEVGAEGLRDISVLATVFEGEPFPVGSI